MFPPGCGELRCTRCFPRVRGDVPPAGPAAVRAPRFSPRARGCSPENVPTLSLMKVFPACAGMFLVHNFLHGGGFSFPRVRGDVPDVTRNLRMMGEFSPRARGCSCKCSVWGSIRCVFPACAGMFRSCSRAFRAFRCFPRVRGDVPVNAQCGGVFAVFSPRARGCSLLMLPPPNGRSVFPACAGMFQTGQTSGLPRKSFPRVRGDVPA